jgi:hypothetical protein
MSSAPELERVQLPGMLATLPGDQGTCPPEGSSGPDVVDDNFQCLHLRLLVSHGIEPYSRCDGWQAGGNG